MSESGSGRPGRARCAVHPSRLAADSCPRCGRPRCGTDAARFSATGCGSCAVPARLAVPASESLLRAALGAYAIAILGGWVGTQYVDVHLFSVVAPALVGLASAWAATAAAGATVTGAHARRRVALVAAAGAVLSAALAFRLESGGGQDPLGSWGEVGPPYLFAIVGTLAWPVLFSAPNPHRRRARQRGRSTVK